MHTPRHRAAKRAHSPLLSRRTVCAALLVGLAVGTFAQGCKSDSRTVGTETNWLAFCNVSSDCSGAADCYCGICTVQCATNADCSGAPLGVECALQVGQLSAQCGGFEPLVGLCLPPAPLGDGGDADGGLMDDGAGAPTVSEGSIVIDASACSGAVCIIGDEIVVGWDNSATGDGNPDVSEASQVVFDLSAVGGLAAQPATGSAQGVFSLTYTVVAGSIDTSGLTVSVTVTDDDGNVTGPATSSSTVAVDNEAPSANRDSVLIDAMCPCGVGDEVAFLWDPYVAPGFENEDVTASSQVLFDLTEFGAGVVNPPFENSSFRYAYTIPADTAAYPTASFTVIVTDDAGNTTTFVSPDSFSIEAP